MKINWKVRFKNKPWLLSFCALIVSFAFDLLAMFDVFPTITQSMVMQLVNIVLMVLSAMGVVNDPTTPGVEDSERAMTYTDPGVPSDNG
jgi:phi LC3 family holin